MTSFPVHTQDSAPDRAKPILEGAQRAMGFVPNLYGTFAGSPALLEAYTALSKAFDSTSFTATERQVVLLTASFENGCDYCMAAHSTIAGMQKVPADVVEALREGAPIGEARLDALANFTRIVVRERGWASEDDIQAFLAAGFEQPQVLEVILGVGMKTLSNYTNHVASTPLDAAFQPQAWSRPASV
ncbi:MAG: carboxymuconolactone decarboxylase family protein [Planctomycetota bacterium]